MENSKKPVEKSGENLGKTQEKLKKIVEIFLFFCYPINRLWKTTPLFPQVFHKLEPRKRRQVNIFLTFSTVSTAPTTTVENNKYIRSR